MAIVKNSRSSARTGSPLEDTVKIDGVRLLTMLDTVLDVWRTVLKPQIGLVYFSGSYSKICQEQDGCIRGKPLRTAQTEFFTCQSTDTGIGESWSWTLLFKISWQIFRAALRLVQARVLCQTRAPYRPITAHKNFPLPPIAGPQICRPRCCSTLNAALQMLLSSTKRNHSKHRDWIYCNRQATAAAVTVTAQRYICEAEYRMP